MPVSNSEDQARRLTLRHLARQRAGDPGSTKQSQAEYRDRLEAEFQLLLASELEAQEIAVDQSFTLAFADHQATIVEDREREIAIRVDVAKRLTKELEHQSDVDDQRSSLPDQPRAKTERSPSDPSNRSDCDLSASECRHVLGAWMVDSLDPAELTNLEMQDLVNQQILARGLSVTPYDSDDGSGVFSLFKRTYKDIHDRPYLVDRRGRNRKTGK